MKCIIAGTRGCSSMAIVMEAISRSGFTNIEEVVSGQSAGPDTLGAAIAKANGTPVKRFAPDWNGTFPDGRPKGKAAGPERNKLMAEYADAGILVWDGTSPGTRNLQTELQRLGKPHFIFWIKFQDGDWQEDTARQPFWYKPHEAAALTL